MVAADLLVAWFDVALDHETLYHSVKLRIYLAAVKNLTRNTDLLLILLVGVGVISIYDNSRVGKILSMVFVIKETKILVMIVRDCLTMFVYSATKNSMGKRIAGCLYFPASVNKAVCTLSCNDGIQHNAVVTAGWVLHTSRNIHTADSQSVLLVLYRTCTYSNVGEQVRKVTVVLRVKHLISACKTALADSTHMHFTDSDQTCKKVWFFLRIRLMDHSLVSFTCCTRFVCVNTRDDENFVLDLFLYFAKP